MVVVSGRCSRLDFDRRRVSRVPRAGVGGLVRVARVVRVCVAVLRAGKVVVEERGRGGGLCGQGREGRVGGGGGRRRRGVGWFWRVQLVLVVALHVVVQRVGERGQGRKARPRRSPAVGTASLSPFPSHPTLSSTGHGGSSGKAPEAYPEEPQRPQGQPLLSLPSTSDPPPGPPSPHGQGPLPRPTSRSVPRRPRAQCITASSRSAHNALAGPHGCTLRPPSPHPVPSSSLGTLTCIRPSPSEPQPGHSSCLLCSCVDAETVCASHRRATVASAPRRPRSPLTKPPRPSQSPLEDGEKHSELTPDSYHPSQPDRTHVFHGVIWLLCVSSPAPGSTHPPR